MTEREIEILEKAFADLHRKAQTLAYEVSVRPQQSEDWKPVSRALDELIACLDSVRPAYRFRSIGVQEGEPR